MNRRYLKQIANHILKITRNYSAEVPRNFNSFNNMIMFTHNQVPYLLSGELADSYREGLDIFLKESDLNEKYSIKALTQHYNELLGRTFQADEPLDDIKPIMEMLEYWLSDLENRTAQIFSNFIVIQGVEVDRTFDVALVKIEQLTEETSQKLYHKIIEQIDTLTMYTDEQKRQFKESIFKHSFHEFSSDLDEKISLMSTEVEGRDLEYSRQIALERFDDALHTIRFLGIQSDGFNREWSVTLKSSFSNRGLSLLTLTDDDSWSIHNRIGLVPLKSKKFDPRLLQLLNKVTSKREDDRTELDGHILNGIHWIGRGVQEPAETSRFLNLCIALECLLLRDQHGAISKTLNERVAFLLGETLEERKDIYNLMNKIQRVRGSVAHAGRRELNQKDLEAFSVLIRYASWSVIRVIELSIQYQWITFNELKNFLDDLKFGLNASIESEDYM